jgi:F-type H+-transporting ATPase subunit alpha
MKFTPEEITSVIREELSRFRRQVDVSHVGRVLEVGDGIARVFGLSEVMAGEMLEFEHGQMGQALNLEQNAVGAVVYGSCEQIKAGQEVRATGRLLAVPVGEAMLGRVVDPLGRPLDGEGAVAADERRRVEVIAPGIAARQPVYEPLHTGLKAVDALTPIGRGQRELIIGDRKTGKTAIAVDTIINQRGGDMVCVYVAIGQKEAAVAAIVETLKRHDALAHTVIVAASSSDPAPLQYVAPYSGCTIAEHFMTRGKHTLVAYDDLTKQAAAYRQISLLLRRPPGREAYPGDIFYLHSRLLERACKLAERYVVARRDAPPGEAVDEEVYVGVPGRRAAEERLAAAEDAEELELRRVTGSGGSMTALPICETQEGQVEAYIPTNLISITDGQIYLEPRLFFAGVRPAVNVGISVSRVGYRAASSAMRDVAKTLRLDLAAYRELEAFAQLGMELDRESEGRLARGERMVRVLAQEQYQPMPVVDQVIAIFAGTRGLLDDLELDEVAPFGAGLLEYVRQTDEAFYREFSADLSLGPGRARRLRMLAEAYKDGPWVEARRALRRQRMPPPVRSGG